VKNTRLTHDSGERKLNNTGGSSTRASETFETEKPRNVETPQQRTLVGVNSGKEYGEPIAEGVSATEVSTCQRFEVSKVSLVHVSDTQGQEEDVLSREHLIDAKNLEEIDALLEGEVRAWVLRAAQENGWKTLHFSGWPRGGALPLKEVGGRDGVRAGARRGTNTMVPLGWRGV
jgi:hypothetical protein